MTKDWIIEVLGDLRGFAAMNDLPSLAVELEGALVVAIAEIGQQDAVRAPHARSHDAEAGGLAG